MAYWIQSYGDRNTNPGYRSFMCDTEQDIANLPTNKKLGMQQDEDRLSCSKVAYGSDCFCISNGCVYILRKDTDSWQSI